MTQATAELNETAPVDQTDEQFESEMEAAFAEDAQAENPTTTPDVSTQASADPEAEQTPPVETVEQLAVSDVPNELETALSRIAKLEDNHKKYSDDVFGRVGMLEQVIKAQARTPAGQKVQVKIEDFGEFGEEYPDFAKAQMKVLNQVLSQLEVSGVSSDFTTELIQSAKQAAEQAAEQRYEQRRAKEAITSLNDTHPGWQQIVGVPDKALNAGGVVPDTEYRRWLSTQPKEYADAVLSSYSDVMIGRSLDKFASWKQAQEKQKVKPSQQQVPSRREHQLRSAVPARTTGVQPRQRKELTEEEAMQAAFEGRL